MFETQKEVVKNWLAGLGGDREQIWKSYLACDPAMTWTLIGSTPISGTYRGLEEIKNDFQSKCWNGDGREGSGPQGLDQNYGIHSPKVNEVIALEDGRVLVHCISDGKGKNGIPYKNEYCWIFRVEGEKIVSIYEFADTVLIERALFNKELIPAELVR